MLDRESLSLRFTILWIDWLGVEAAEAIPIEQEI
jgi:hypothetical protein